MAAQGRVGLWLGGLNAQRWWQPPSPFPNASVLCCLLASSYKQGVLRASLDLRSAPSGTSGWRPRAERAPGDPPSPSPSSTWDRACLSPAKRVPGGGAGSCHGAGLRRSQGLSASPRPAGPAGQGDAARTPWIGYLVGHEERRENSRSSLRRQTAGRGVQTVPGCDSQEGREERRPTASSRNQGGKESTLPCS